MRIGAKRVADQGVVEVRTAEEPINKVEKESPEEL